MTEAQPDDDIGERGRYWDRIYRDTNPTDLSWYQPEPAISLELIARFGVPRDAPIIDVGGGASNLVDDLIDRDFTDVSVLDVSAVALDVVRRRLGPTPKVRLFRADVLAWHPTRQYALWHDRAVFHFLVDASDRRRYLETMHAALSLDGLAILATFAQHGPERCSGLPVARYSAGGLGDLLGGELEIVATGEQRHTTPAGHVQPFTWVAGRLRTSALEAT